MGLKSQFKLQCKLPFQNEQYFLFDNHISVFERIGYVMVKDVTEAEYMKMKNFNCIQALDPTLNPHCVKHTDIDILYFFSFRKKKKSITFLYLSLKLFK